MTNNDLNQIGKLLDEKLTAAEKRLKTEIAGTRADLKTEIAGTRADLKTEIAGTEKNLRSEITAVEKRLNKKLTSAEKRLIRAEERLKAEIIDSGDNIIEEIAGFMEANILPKLKEKADKSAVDRCERRIDLLADKVGEHDARLKDVKSIPVITHQLKIKKIK